MARHKKRRMKRGKRARVAGARSFDEVGAVVEANALSDAIERAAGTVELKPPVPILLPINEIRGGPTE